MDSMEIARELGGVLLSAYPHLKCGRAPPGRERDGGDPRLRRMSTAAKARCGRAGSPPPARRRLMLSGGIDSRWPRI